MMRIIGTSHSLCVSPPIHKRTQTELFQTLPRQHPHPNSPISLLQCKLIDKGALIGAVGLGFFGFIGWCLWVFGCLGLWVWLVGFFVFCGNCSGADYYRWGFKIRIRWHSSACTAGKPSTHLQRQGVTPPVVSQP